MKRVFCIICALAFLLSGCGRTPQAEDWGSFTAEAAYSYDGAFYAVQDTEEKDGVAYAAVHIHDAEGGGKLFSFTPARAMDFWGVCWERDTYNLWVQSGDVGTLCYAYEDGRWSAAPSAVRPEYIVSKYD